MRQALAVVMKNSSSIAAAQSLDRASLVAAIDQSNGSTE
jgi:hypothetical protein